MFLFPGDVRPSHLAIGLPDPLVYYNSPQPNRTINGSKGHAETGKVIETIKSFVEHDDIQVPSSSIQSIRSGKAILDKDIDVLASWVFFIGLYKREGVAEGSQIHKAFADQSISPYRITHIFTYRALYLYELYNDSRFEKFPVFEQDTMPVPGDWDTPSKVLSRVCKKFNVTAEDLGEMTVYVLQSYIDYECGDGTIHEDLKLVLLYKFFVLSCTPFLLDKFFVPFWQKNARKLFPMIAFSGFGQVVFSTKGAKTTMTRSKNCSDTGYSSYQDYLFTVLCENGLVSVNLMIDSLYQIEANVAEASTRATDKNHPVELYYRAFSNYAFFHNKDVRDLILCKFIAGHEGQDYAFPHLHKVISYFDNVYASSPHTAIERYKAQEIINDHADYGFVIDQVCRVPLESNVATVEEKFHCIGRRVLERMGISKYMHFTRLRNRSDKITVLLFALFFQASMTSVLVYADETFRQIMQYAVKVYFGAYATGDFALFKKMFIPIKSYTTTAILNINMSTEHERLISKLLDMCNLSKDLRS